MDASIAQFINYMLTDGLPWLVLIGAIVLVVFIGLIARSFAPTPEGIGKWGELRTARYLQKLPQDTYVVFNDLIVADSEGRTTQIDHVVVSHYGIFVVETKCYKGWIFGNEKSRTWTQSLWGWYGSSEKHQFQNPIRQNWRHIYVLAEKLRLPKNVFHNVVVFSGDSAFMTDMPYNVMTEYDVAGYIESYSVPLLTEGAMRRVCGSLVKFALHTDETHKELTTQHVQMLSEYHKTEREESPFCPVCGSQMRKRHRRSDSAPFYGCVRYPMCKGTRNIEEKESCMV